MTNPVPAGLPRCRCRIPIAIRFNARTIPRPTCRSALLSLALLGASAVPADDGRVLPVPEVPAPYTGDSVGVPEVTIRETETEVIYEYRIRGRIYMVRIDPIAGPPYYLLDIDGDGELDVQQQEMPELAVPQWQLFSW
jgi:hypothetical protein